MRVSVVAVFLLVFVACPVVVDSPVDCPPGSEVDHAPFLGEWQATEFSGSPLSVAQVLSIQDASGNLQVSYDAGSELQTVEVHLTNVNGLVVASIQNEGGGWGLAEVRVEDNGNRIALFGISPDRAATDIQSGVLAGSVREWGVGRQAVTMTGSGQELRAYLANNPDVFQERAGALERIH